MSLRDLDKAALRGEPSYVWRAGQERRLEMIRQAAGERLRGRILENGCGVGMYVEHLTPFGGEIIGLEYDWERAAQAGSRLPRILNAAGESLPFPSIHSNHQRRNVVAPIPHQRLLHQPVRRPGPRPRSSGPGSRSST